MKNGLFLLIIFIACLPLALQAAQEGDEEVNETVNAYIQVVAQAEGWNIPSFDIRTVPASEKKQKFITAVFGAFIIDIPQGFAKGSQLCQELGMPASDETQMKDKKRAEVKKLFAELMSMQPQEKNEKQASVLSDDDGYTSFD